jgi:hypothetical protein
MTTLSKDVWDSAMLCCCPSIGGGRRFCWKFIFPAESVELGDAYWLCLSSSMISVELSSFSNPRGGDTCAGGGNAVCREGGLGGEWRTWSTTEDFCPGDMYSITDCSVSVMYWMEVGQAVLQ